MSRKPCKSVCNDCPFRTNAIKGWIGGHEDPSEITTIIFDIEQSFPCHEAANGIVESGQEFEEATESAPVCLGSLHLLANSCKMPRDRDLAEMVKEAGRSPKVHANRYVFEEFHRLTIKGKD